MFAALFRKASIKCIRYNHFLKCKKSVNSFSFFFTLTVPPRFTKKPKTRYAYEKEDVELECEVYGKPEPKVHWLKNGDVIVQSEYFKLVNGYNLRILGLVRSDAGIYQCFATNPAGAIQATAQLILLQPGLLFC